MSDSTVSDSTVSDSTVSDSTVFELPSLGADMDVGSVIEWFVSPGDTVARGDAVALVATEKADIDVEIWQSGTITELLLEVGREVPVGTPMLRISAPAPAGAPSPAPTPLPSPAPAPPGPPPRIQPIDTSTRRLGSPDRGRRPASPLARTLAAQHDVDLVELVGSGPRGAVLAGDVEAALVAAASDAAPSATDASAPVVRHPDGMRRAIAERMTKANRDIPHYHLGTDVDMGPGLAWLEQHNETRSIRDRVLPIALFVKATAQAAARHGELNGSWTENGFVANDTVDIAIAVSLRSGGLVTPTVRDADQLGLDETMAVIADMVAGARSGSLRSRWMAPAGITVTSLGDRGAQWVQGVIFPPQVALVGFGRIHDRPWALDDVVVVRPVVSVSLAGDHRATDGAAGSRFLSTLTRRLESPEEP